MILNVGWKIRISKLENSFPENVEKKIDYYSWWGELREKWSSGWEISSIFATMTAQSSLKRKKEERIRIQLDKVSRADGWERETFSIIKAERVVVDRSGLLLSKEEKYHQLTLLSHPPHHVVVFHRLCAIWIFLLYTNWKEKNSTGTCNLTKILQPSLKNRTRPPFPNPLERQGGNVVGVGY